VLYLRDSGSVVQYNDIRPRDPQLPIVLFCIMTASLGCLIKHPAVSATSGPARSSPKCEPQNWHTGACLTAPPTRSAVFDASHNVFGRLHDPGVNLRIVRRLLLRFSAFCLFDSNGHSKAGTATGTRCGDKVSGRR
jgi:hypothetical protein